MTPNEALTEWGLRGNTFLGGKDILTELYNTTSRHDSVGLEDSLFSRGRLNHDLGIFNVNNWMAQKVDFQFYENNKTLPYLIVKDSENLPVGVEKQVRLELMVPALGFEPSESNAGVTFEFIESEGIDYYYFFKGRQTRLFDRQIHLGESSNDKYYLISDFWKMLAKTLNWTTFPKSLIE